MTFVRNSAARALLMVVAVATILAPLSAQDRFRPRRVREKILVLAPTVGAHADSAFSVELADALRERVASVSRFRITVIPKTQISEALQASGFNRDALLDATTSGQLARFLSAHAYTWGRITRSSNTRRVDLQIVDLNRSGASGRIVVNEQDGQSTEDLVETLADSVDVILRSAEKVRDCEEDRGKNKLDNALKKADEALKIYPGNGSAYLCKAVVREVQGDDAAWREVLEQGVQADRGNPTLWDRLARLYQRVGDRLGELRAFRGKLDASPNDGGLRLSVARLYAMVEEVDSAISVLDRGLEINPSDMAILEAKEDICIDAGRWDCIIATLEFLAELDTTIIDTVFYLRVIGATQQAGDTAKQLEWTRRAARNYPDRAAFWKALGEAYSMFGRSDSAVMAYGNAFRLDSTDINSALAVAQARIEASQIDSITWRILSLVADRGSARERAQSALLMIRYGSEVVQQQQNWPRAVEFLERALAVDSATPARNSAAFLLGIGYFQMSNVFYRETHEAESWSCEKADQLRSWLERGRAYLEEGASVQPSRANQFLGLYQQFAPIPGQVKEILKCS